jgi:hypothetical protein
MSEDMVMECADWVAAVHLGSAEQRRGSLCTTAGGRLLLAYVSL